MQPISQNIDSHASLRYRIMQLNALKVEQEEKIARGFKELKYSMQPGELLRSAVQSASPSGTSVTGGIAKLGTDFLIRKVIGNRFGIKGYLASIALEKVANMAISSPSVLTGGYKMIKGLFAKKDKK